MKFIRLPSIIGFMLAGVLLGPSLFSLLSSDLSEKLSFITEIALGFVAASIGLELSFKTLKLLGRGIPLIIVSESLLAFTVVTAGIFMLTGDLPLSLIFGAIAPASAPAGTVAVIQEYRARGSLTKALYAVVGFDDGLGIVIYGFALAFARNLLLRESAELGVRLWSLLAVPLEEIVFSAVTGAGMAFFFSLLARKLKAPRDLYILIVAIVLMSTGISLRFHLSLILTNLILGIVVVNTQHRSLVEKIRVELEGVLPLLFVLFFILAGANLHVRALPALGLIGIVYVFCRTLGLMGGAWLGATLGRAEKKIRKYLGLGILSQAGVAIGLALITKHELSGLGAHGVAIGTTVITTITATSILFEIVGPILTRLGLSKAGEIGKSVP
jgi:Kef-type K+ transport system membrane component KefB